MQKAEQHNSVESNLLFISFTKQAFWVLTSQKRVLRQMGGVAAI